MVLCLIVGCGTRTGKAHTHREKVRLFHLESKKVRFQPLKSFFGNAEGHEVAGLSHNRTADTLGLLLLTFNKWTPRWRDLARRDADVK